MEAAIAPLQTKDERRYARLDRFLLHLIAAELGFFILLIFAGVVVALLVLLLDFAPDSYDPGDGILWPAAVYILALPLNMVGGFVSLVLNLRLRRNGYPGTGHLLNWIFLACTAWLFLLALAFWLSEMARSYYW